MKTKTAKINKHLDWRLSKAEKNWYYCEMRQNEGFAYYQKELD